MSMDKKEDPHVYGDYDFAGGYYTSYGGAPRKSPSKKSKSPKRSSSKKSKSPARKSPKSPKSPKRRSPSRSPSRKSSPAKKKSGSPRKKSAWMIHLAKFYKENKGRMTYSQAMKAAKASYYH